MSDALTMYVVYDHPSDFPDKFVVRPRHIRAGQDVPSLEAYTADDLEPLREMLERKGLTRMARQPEDDPVIVEVWF